MNTAIGRVLWVAAFVVIGALNAMADDGTGNTRSPTSAADGEKPKVVIDQSSAKATLDTMAKAFKARDGAALTACLPPEYKDSMGPAFVGMMDVVGKAESLKKTAEAKLGKDVAEKGLKGSPAESITKGGPLEDCLSKDGTIDWKKAKVTENGDTATFEVEGKSNKETLKKINGKWCMAAPEGMTPEKARKDGEQAKKMMKAMGDALADVDKQVKDGKIGRDDLQKALEDAVIKVIGEAMKDAPPN